MRRAVLIAGLLAGAALAADLPHHPVQLAPLTLESTFPRFTAEELAAAGYPDHLHVHTYPGFQPFVDADGQTYGPRSLASGTLVLPRPDLLIDPAAIRYRGLHMSFNPGYDPSHMLPMIELLDWARRDLSHLLGHDRGDTLRIVNPDNLDHYTELTGYQFHRLYQRQPDGSYIIEPLPILRARGLDAHAAHHLMATWLLADLTAGAALPEWLIQGLGWYLSEEGTTFLNYLAMYRAERPVILTPDAAEAILAGPPDPDKETDKVQYRTAGYTAFLMVWELVENRGGLDRLRDLLTRVGAGEDPDAVCRELYDHDLAGLAVALDPTRRDEPVGDAVLPRVVTRPPAP